MNHLIRRFAGYGLHRFSSKKLGIADTAKVIQDKILNISQVVMPWPYAERRQGVRHSHQYR